jgi:hypothetical protein
MGIGLLIGALVGVSWAQECEDVAVLVAQAEGDVESFFLAEAESELNRAKIAYGCGPIADPEVLARLWQTEGVTRVMKGEEADSVGSFAASARVAPGVWNENYGPQMRKKYDLAVAEVGQGESQLRLRALPKGFQVVLDGQIAEAPYKTQSGLHLVQAGPPEANAEWARVIDLPPEEQVVVLVDTGTLAVEGEPVEVVIVKSYKGHPSRTIAIVGGVAAVAAGASFVVATVANDRFMKEKVRDDATAHLMTNRASNVTGIVLGATAGGLVLGAVIQGKW